MSTPTTSFTPRFVIVARHGERLDYVSRDAGNPWTFTAARPYDPPLTDHGRQQAHKLGQHLRTELQQRGIPPITAIYTSPFLRCRQTAVAAAAGYTTASTTTGKDSPSSSSSTSPPPPVRVEYGLSESFNESWFRSWALPGSDGTWGYRINKQNSKNSNDVDTTIVDDSDLSNVDPQHFHAWARQPIQALPLFTDYQTEQDATALVDLTYTSQTQIVPPFALHPFLLESRQEQAARMKQVVTATAASPTDTILLTSHGAPVQHLFAELTGQRWQDHGPSVYCCYSIYQSTPDGWKAIAVNQSAYLKEKLEKDNYVTGDETTK